MSFTELVVAMLATWQLVEIWHHSRIMAPWRARMELREDWIGELLGCPYCLSVWCGWFCGLVLWGATGDGGGTILRALWDWVMLVPRIALSGLAISRAANLGNDLSHAWCRTTRENKFTIPISNPLLESTNESAESSTAGATDVRPSDHPTPTGSGLGRAECPPGAT